MNKKELLMIKNAEGKRLLQKTKLEYSSEIINILKDNPDIYNDLLNKMELTPKEFINYLSGDEDANIVVFDTLLDKSMKMVEEKK